VIMSYGGNVASSSVWSLARDFGFKQATLSNGKAAFDNSTSLNPDYSSSPDIPLIIASHIDSGELPVDPNGLYWVFTSSSVYTGTQSFGGWHTSPLQLPSRQFQFFFGYVGFPNCSAGLCQTWICANGFPSLSTCQGVNGGLSPNGDPGLDVAINIFSHEIWETMTDPYASAHYGWYATNATLAPDQGEVGDLCDRSFNTAVLAPEGYYYNVVVGGRRYLTQDIISPFSQTCRNSGASPAPSSTSSTGAPSSSGVATSAVVAAIIISFLVALAVGCLTGYAFGLRKWCFGGRAPTHNPQVESIELRDEPSVAVT